MTLRNLPLGCVQIQNGATYVRVDKILSPKDGSPALLAQGNLIFSLGPRMLKFNYNLRIEPWWIVWREMGHHATYYAH